MSIGVPLTGNTHTYFKDDRSNRRVTIKSGNISPFIKLKLMGGDVMEQMCVEVERSRTIGQLLNVSSAKSLYMILNLANNYYPRNDEI